MSLVIDTDPVPLKTDAFGVVHVGKSRVTLDTIVIAYLQGSTAEEIAEQYPTITLPDIHAVISFYLRRREEVETYLEERNCQRETVRRENEKRFPSSGIRKRLLATRALKQQ